VPVGRCRGAVLQRGQTRHAAGGERRKKSASRQQRPPSRARDRAGHGRSGRSPACRGKGIPNPGDDRLDGSDGYRRRPLTRGPGKTAGRGCPCGGKCPAHCRDVGSRRAGATAILEACHLERAFRDVHAAAKHIAMSARAALSWPVALALVSTPGDARFWRLIKHGSACVLAPLRCTALPHPVRQARTSLAATANPVSLPRSGLSEELQHGCPRRLGGFGVVAEPAEFGALWQTSDIEAMPCVGINDAVQARRRHAFDYAIA
jgi:hypothetical protein